MTYGLLCDVRYPEIAAGIKQARLARKWSQERAAAEIGTSRIHWIRWEQGLHKPTPEFAQRLVERLGVPGELFEDPDEEEDALQDLARGIKAFVRSELQRAS